jgi:hypothetical protein
MSAEYANHVVIESGASLIQSPFVWNLLLRSKKPHDT